MVYLEYHKQTKQVVEIYETEPILNDINYDYGISEDFQIGDEFELTIWINEVGENKNILSFSAVRNNPQAKRLLEENHQLKKDNEQLRLEMAQSNTELFEMMIAMSGGTA